MSRSLQNLSIHQLRTFLEVARSGTLTRAASRLGYAQSSVTVHIRALERCLGTQLLYRHSQGVRLTAEGAAVVEYATQVLEIIDQMFAGMKTDDRVVGRVMVGGPAVLTSYYLGPVLRRCRQLYPDLNVSTRTMRPGEIEKALRSGEIDVGFSLSESDESWLGHDQPLQWRVLCPVDFVPVTSAGRLGKPANRSRAGSVVIDDPECLAQRAFAKEFRKRFGKVLSSIEVGSIAGVLDTLHTEDTVAVVPRIAAESRLAAERVSIDSRLPCVYMHARASWRTDLSDSVLVRAVVRTAAEVLREYPQSAANSGFASRLPTSAMADLA